MSHFTVLVTKTNKTPIDEQLAPFDENIDVEAYTDEDGETTTYNQRSKWDWYLIGGRWTGFFTLKNGKKGKLGKPGVMMKRATSGADIALVKDIDWEKTDSLTFAVLHNSEWYERGEMGWWGMVSNEKSSQDWQAKFDEIIASLDPEDEVTVVDAHI